MSGRDANQLAADRRRELLEALTGDATYWPDSAETALDEYVAMRVGTLQQERDGYLQRLDDQVVWRQREEVRAVAAEAALATTRQALADFLAPWGPEHYPQLRRALAATDRDTA